MILASQDGPEMRYMHVLRFERYIKSKAVDTEKEKQEKKKRKRNDARDSFLIQRVLGIIFIL